MAAGMKTIIILALSTWGVICAGAWRLADARIAICGPSYDPSKAGCIIRATATRDDVLLWGPAVALVALIVLAVLLQRSGRLSSPAGRATHPAANQKPLLRD